MQAWRLILTRSTPSSFFLSPVLETILTATFLWNRLNKSDDDLASQVTDTRSVDLSNVKTIVALQHTQDTSKNDFCSCDNIYKNYFWKLNNLLSLMAL